MLWFFYTESDKIEIQSWIKDSHRNPDLPLYQRISNLEKEILSLKAELDAIKRKPDSFSQLKAEILSLKAELDAVKSKPDSSAQLKAEILSLKAELDAVKSKPDSSAQLQAEILNLKAELDAIKSKPDSSTQLQSEILSLRAELDAIKSKPDSSAELKAVKLPPVVVPAPAPPPKKIEVKPQEISTPPSDSAEKIFYLKNRDEIFITDDRKNIPAQIRKALNVDDMKNFLLADNSEISKKFQKLLNVHVNAVKNFADKLKLNDLDDEELSETVTGKYFKLFQQIIFDNLLVAITRGLKTSENFYPKFLAKINFYLEQCGIYSVNAKSGVKVTDEDYQNMSPQIIKTSDKTKAGIIGEIERLPYRINYLDEFGDKKFFQYNGVMSVYKAV